jgi:hypothetical protein
MKRGVDVFCIVTALVIAVKSLGAKPPGNVLTTNTPVELTRFDAKLLDSANSRDRSELLGEILFGIVQYSADLGDVLYAQYQTETNTGVRMDMLAVLHKYKHPSVSSLVAQTIASTNSADREIVDWVGSGAYSNAVAPITTDLLCARAKQYLRRMDKLTRPLWIETLFSLRYNATACGYDDKIGDALAEFFLEHPGSDFFQIRVGISFVLLDQNHPSLPRLIEELKKSTSPDDHDLAVYLESKQKGRVMPQKP